MKANLKRIETRRVPDQIIQQITGMIETGKLKIGDKLPSETVLMKELGVGRSSIREAVGALSMTGVLSVKQGRGTYVTASPNSHLASPLKWTDLKGYDKAKELIDARIALDMGILTSAIEKASKKDIKDLRTVLRRLDSARKSREEYIETEKVFHSTLARSSHNAIMMRFYDELKPLIYVWMEMSSQIELNLTVSYEEHVAMVESIERKDLEKARQAVLQHLKEIGHFPV